jgi:hypothetical protein
MQRPVSQNWPALQSASPEQERMQRAGVKNVTQSSPEAQFARLSQVRPQRFR